MGERLENICYNSNDLRRFTRIGKIIGSGIDDKQIQPASFDPRLGDEVFAISTRGKPLFRPRKNEQVYRTLLERVPLHRRQRHSSNGYELKVGFTYAIKLEEKIRIDKGEKLKSSPKSSLGRLFLNTRLMADYNDSFDEAYPNPNPLDLWLLVQPLAFNVLIQPGLRINQIRLFNGDARLTDNEILEAYGKTPILLDKFTGKSLVPNVDSGLQIHLDLEGKATQGIVGFRAMDNPEPIDLSKKGKHDSMNYFEPIKKGNVYIQREDHCLFPTLERLQFPSTLNGELIANSHIGMSGPWHFAGFIDNGFDGDLVLELRSQELTSMELEHGMPVSRMDIFRTNKPDKIYGKSIKSNYQDQKGARIAKFFGPFDYNFAAKNYGKLNRDALVREADALLQHRLNNEAFEPTDNESQKRLFDDINKGFFLSRYDCEDDALVLQPIPYIILFGPDETVYTYVRSGKIEEYGEPKLFDKHSIGIGGHISREDAPDYVQKCLQRELSNEVQIEGKYSNPFLVGTLMCYTKPVDRVHLGLIYAVMTSGNVKHSESSIQKGNMTGIQELLEFPLMSEAFESWSNELIPHLKAIYKKLSPLE